jgi:predicted phosphoribosyltransferase
VLEENAMRNGMVLFEDRRHAARLLARELLQYRGRHPLMLGVPRGGVPIASALAEALGGDLDVVLVRKLGAPGEPELAIGAVDETGQIYVHSYARSLGVSTLYLENEAKTQLEVLGRRRSMYTPYRTSIDPSGRIVIVVDDGCATGASLTAALRSVRAKKPDELIAAVPVASSSALRLISQHADRVICLEAPESFLAVGEFYRDFSPVSDEEVAEVLRQSSYAPAAPR